MYSKLYIVKQCNNLTIEPLEAAIFLFYIIFHIKTKQNTLKNSI